jgi:murein DD-endopeptidase MepM/ murein hydrolase activator NlpD
MLRLVLVLALAGFAGLIGYYIGRQAPVPATPSAVQETGERARLVSPTEAEGASAPHVPAVPTEPAIPARTPEAVPADPEPLLKGRKIALPIAGLKAESVHDTFDAARGGGDRRHEAADIMAPRGTPVLAVDDGIIQKLFSSKPGGLTIYQFDGAEQYCYYYAHLDGYAPGLKEGMLVRRGDTIGFVGTSGNADPDSPHLHFAIFKLGPEKRWWEGNRPVNPYPILMAQLQGQR